MAQHDAEKLRIYNARFEPIGTASRRRVHEEGLWHETFHCWIIVPDGKLLLQMRSASKDVWPSRLDATAGGHLGPGEPVREGVLREMREEIGRSASEEDLVFAGVRVGVDEFSDGVKNYELLHVYFAVLDDVEGGWTLQASEVDALLEAPIDDLLKLLAGTVERAPVRVVASSADSRIMHITRADFPETLDDYYYKVAILARRLLHGDEHLRI